MNPRIALLTTGLWAMQTERLDALMEVLTARANDPGDTIVPNDPADDERHPNNGVATIAVVGSLLKTGAAELRDWGMEATGYDEISAQLAAANANPDVHAIVLAIDSPGGQVSGCQALADQVAASAKPVIAQVSDLCASAAYWIAAQCDSIAANRTALIGSIGVYSVVRDTSRLLENMGVKTHLISSGGVKGAGASGTVVTEAQLAESKKMIDAICGHFVAAVSSGRGVSATEAAAWADGRVYLASEAQHMGLIDRISNTAEAYQMKIAPARMEALVDQHPTRAAAIVKMCAADKSEDEIVSAIKDAQTSELAAKSSQLADAHEALKVQAAKDLQAAKDEAVVALAAKDAEFAALKIKHDALSALASNGVRDPGGKPGATGSLPVFTTADSAAGRIPAELLASGKYTLAE